MIDKDVHFEALSCLLPTEIQEIIKKNNIKSFEELDKCAEFIEFRNKQEDDDFTTNDEEQSNITFFKDEKPMEYHLRVKLSNSPIPIWREVKVPSNITLEFLALIINELIGWEGYHLHQFVIDGIFYENTELLAEEEDFILPFSPRIQKRDSNHYAISEIFKEKGKRVKYEYDFGDGWEHDVWLKGTRQYEAGEKICLEVVKGKGMDTIEDCGGVWGLEEIIHIHSKKRKTAKEKEMLQWYGIDEDTDVEYFYKDAAQEALDALWNEALSYSQKQ